MKKIILVGVLLLGGLILFLGKRPSKGEIVMKKTGEAISLNRLEQFFQNDYLSFKYPDDYEKRSEENNLWLAGRKVPESITVICRKYTGDIDQDSGVMMRRVKKDQYNESQVEIDGVVGQYFEKNDLSERTIFVVRNETMITFSMTANSNDESLGNKFQKIIDSWSWI